jgi:SAM-dependent methyltransferase
MRHLLALLSIFPWRTLPSYWKARAYRPYKARYFHNLTGPILELGAGSGVNFAYYPRGAPLTVIEPNTRLHPWLHWRAKQAGLPLTCIANPAQLESFPAHAFQTVVGTLVLCAVPQPQETLQHIRRVLRPGGSYVFLEHILAPPETRQRRWQQRLNPWFRRYLAACDCHRPTDHTIAQVFPHAHTTHFQLPGGFPLTNRYLIGRATT